MPQAEYTSHLAAAMPKLPRPRAKRCSAREVITELVEWTPTGLVFFCRGRRKNPESGFLRNFKDFLGPDLGLYHTSDFFGRYLQVEEVADKIGIVGNG